MALLNQQLTMFTTFFFFLPLMINSVSFNTTHFDSNTANMEYRGDARPSAGDIELNKDGYFRLGQVICAEPVRLQDFSTKQVTDFTTHFSFIVNTLGRDHRRYGDGILFFIVPVGFQSPENSGGGRLGLFPNPLMSKLSKQKHQIVLVEFDSFVNSEGWDPPYEHVGINVNSLNSSVYTPWNASFHSGDTTNVWISYNASTLRVSWSYQTTSNPQENSTLSFHFDLREVFPMEWVKVGIGAATGFFSERHILKSWQFSSSLGSKETKKSKIDKIKVIVLPCIGALIVGSIVAYFTIWGRKKLRNKQNTSTEGISLIWIIQDLERGAALPRRFSYRDLVSATNNFSDDRKLGQGGFGAVYKGHLTKLDIDVAVKKFFRGSKQGQKEYIAEVTIVSRLRHRNLVKLIGWCHDRGQFLLVYEFMPNGSLDSHLFGRNCTLTWATRYKICLGLATALFYLHNDWEQCVVHRDIKTGNVLLDSCFNVKLGDFGLARLMDHELGPRTTCLAGTLGYMAPEYIISGKASSKSDVFSFGVVTLEIVTGSRARDPRNNEMGLIERVWDLYGQGKPLAAVDERLQMEFDEQQAKCMAMVGLWCAHPDYTLRPSIRQAIQILNFEVEMPDLPLQMPVPMYQVPPASPPDSLSEPLITNSFFETGR